MHGPLTIGEDRLMQEAVTLNSYILWLINHLPSPGEVGLHHHRRGPLGYLIFSLNVTVGDVCLSGSSVHVVYCLSATSHCSAYCGLLTWINNIQMATVV